MLKKQNVSVGESIEAAIFIGILFLSVNFLCVFGGAVYYLCNAVSLIQNYR